jgi:photosystem II stability/assembly factor-like uncharacterized protein
MKGLILLVALTSTAFAINYHGCTLAPDNVNGWIVCLDTTLIIHTSDGGTTWIPQEVPPDTIARRLWDVTCYDGSRAWTTGKHNLHAGEILGTTDGGNLWERQEAGFSKYGTRIEFIDQNHGWAVGGDGALARTTNGGQLWERVFTDWYQAEYYGVSFVNQWDGWICAGWPDSMAAGQGYIVATNDGGIFWDTLDGYHAAGYEDFFDIHFFNINEGIVVGGVDGTYEPIVWKTTNGGDTWNPISVPANVYYLRAVDFVELEGWAVGKSGSMIHTTDGGNTWTPQSSTADSTLFDVDFIDHLNGLACGYDHILRTTNGGQDWLRVGIEEIKTEAPQQVSLTAKPNPFSKLTNINYGVEPSAQRIELNIYDACGRLVRSFYPVSSIQYQESSVLWDGTDNQGIHVPAGIYFVRLGTREQTTSEKLVLLE